MLFLARRSWFHQTRRCCLYKTSLLAGFLYVTSASSISADEIRMWTDSTGKFTREGQFVRLEGGEVFLRLTNGKEISIKASRLCDADRKYIESLAAKKEPASPTYRQLIAQHAPKIVPPTGLSDREQQEARVLGKRVEDAFAAGSEHVLEMFDKATFAGKTMETLELPAEAKTAMTASATAGLENFWANMVKTVDLQFLRARRVGPSRRLLFRLKNKETQLPGYCEVEYDSAGSGVTPLKDIFIFALDECFSQTMRRGNIMLAATVDRGIVAKLFGGDADIVKHNEDLKRVIDLSRQGKHAEAIAVLKTLPDSLRKDKTYLGMYVGLAQKVSLAEHQAAVREFEETFPGSAMLAFVQLGAEDDLKRGSRQLETINAAIGGDPYLDFLRGNLCFRIDDEPSAVEYWLKAVAVEPTMTAAHVSLMEVYTKRKDYRRVAEVLAFLEDDLGLDLSGELIDDPRWQDFLASDPGKNWKSSREPTSGKQ